MEATVSEIAPSYLDYTGIYTIAIYEIVNDFYAAIDVYREWFYFID